MGSATKLFEKRCLLFAWCVCNDSIYFDGKPNSFITFAKKYVYYYHYEDDEKNRRKEPAVFSDCERDEVSNHKRKSLLHKKIFAQSCLAFDLFDCRFANWAPPSSAFLRFAVKEATHHACGKKPPTVWDQQTSRAQESPITPYCCIFAMHVVYCNTWSTSRRWFLLG